MGYDFVCDSGGSNSADLPSFRQRFGMTQHLTMKLHLTSRYADHAHGEKNIESLLYFRLQNGNLKP
jgi:hypothetical protein